MAAQTADRNFKIRAGGYLRTIIGKLAAATKVYRGSLGAKNAAGFILPAADAANYKVVAVIDEQVDNTGGAAGALEVRMTTGVVKLDNSGTDPVVQANMHGYCFVEDDHTVRATGGTNSIRAGVVELIESDGVWVKVEPEISNA